MWSRTSVVPLLRNPGIKTATDQKRRDVIIPGDTPTIALYSHVLYHELAHLLPFYTTCLCTFMQNVWAAPHIPRDLHALIFAPGVIAY